ncbi:MAG: bifunctional riboflavin kinase/FAD synthetase [Bergeyella zoohelcum]|nr:bifunctional riboflavin kinase/FAD synthetase [Bergeyella zoohelcum]
MEVFTDFNAFQKPQPLALSLGMFDGVHIGHQSIISELKKQATEKKQATAILSFWPHPRLVFNPNEPLKLLNTIEEKTNLLAHFGIDFLFLKEFDESFRNLTGEEFVREILVQTLNVKHLIVGYDHTFGKNKSGDFSLLERLAPELGFSIQKMEAINLHNNNVSSTKIRAALSEGNILKANEFLGYHYSVGGKVIHGKKIGRTIGYPTANVEISPIKLLPKKGAYIVEVLVDNEKHKGMLSIGTNPTVNGTTLSTEVHILDFQKDIYGKEISIYFRDFLHEEIKFDNLQQLITRLDEDKKRTEIFRF